jgi:hypothetical protein
MVFEPGMILDSLPLRAMEEPGTAAVVEMLAKE